MFKKLLTGVASASVMLMAATAAHAQSAYFQAITNLNPVAYWPLQETIQPQSADVETNLGSLGALGNAYYSAVNPPTGNAGVRKGAPGAIVAESDSSVSFPSMNGAFLAVPQTDPRVSLPGPAFTVEAWVYPTNSAAFVGIVSQTGPYANPTGLNGLNTNSGGWTLVQNYIPSDDNGNFRGWCFHVFNGVGPNGGAEATAICPNMTSGNLVLNQWYHIVGVFDGTHATLYVNGVNGTTGYSYPINGSYVRDTWDPLFIGENRGFNNNRYQGYIDEVAIYTNALSPSQIANHYATAQNASPATPYEQVVLNDNPFTYWRMNAPAYTHPVQASFPVAINYGLLGTNLANVPNGMAVYGPGTVPGVAGPQYAGMMDPAAGNNSYAVAINGIGGNWDNNAASAPSYVDCGYNKVLDPTGSTNQFSVIAWFKGNPMDANGRWMDVVGHSDSSWRIHFNNGAPNFSHGGNNDISVPVTSINLNDGNWHMIAGVYGITNNDAIGSTNETIIVDGSVVVNRINEPLTVPGTTRDVLIGCAPDNTSSGNGNSFNQRFFAGRIAHVAIFTNALTTQQVRTLYATANPGMPPAIVTQPTSGITTNVAGTSKTFTVVATGTSLSLQWYFTNSGGTTTLTDDSVHISGSTTATLTITNLVNSLSGYYYVVASSAFGSVTSILSGVQVAQLPVITAQTPVGPINLFSNQNVMITVTATGATPLLYYWYTNTVLDASQTGATYTTANAQAGLVGTTYSGVVSNAFGLATNAVVTLSSIMPLPTSTYAQAVLGAGGLLPPATGYWPLHENTPPAIYDIETNYGTLGTPGTAYYADWNRNAGNPNNGLPDRVAVHHQIPGALTGDSDTAVYLDNQPGSYLVIPHTSPATTLSSQFTLEAWVKPYNDTGYGIIIGSGGNSGFNGSANRGGFRWLWAGTANSFSITMFNGTNTGSTEPRTAAIYYPGTWYHLVTTFDGSTIAYYVNGTQVGLANASSASLGLDNFSPLTIGGGNWNGNINNLFNGAIDEVAIYTNVLDPTRIAAHYTAGSSATPSPTYNSSVLSDNPLIYLRMNSPAAVLPPVSSWPVLTNYGTASLNGTYWPGTMPGNVPAPGVAGKNVVGLAGTNALGCNGLSQFANAGLRPEFNPTGKTPISVAAWFKCSPADNRFQAIFGHTDSSWRCAIDTSGKLHWNAGAGAEITSVKVCNDGSWHHLIGTFNGGTNVLYIDGKLDSTLTGATTITGSTLPVFIGGDPQYTNNPAGPGRNFAGSVCELSFWNGVALSSNQVSALYGVAGVAPFIATQPVVLNSANQNSAFTNSVVVSGSAPLFYQWYRNNLPIPVSGETNLPVGGTNSTLILNPVQVTDQSTNYYVVITNSYGSVTSLVWSLNPVYSTPVFTAEPILVTLTNNITLFTGAHPTFKVAAIGAQPITYQWFTNGVPATVNTTVSTNYTLPTLGLNGLTNVFCVASNFVGKTTNNAITLSVTPAPTTPYPQAVMAANPIGYWRLNEPEQGGGDAGVLANDFWGGANGIYTNTVLGNQGYSQNTDVATTSAEFGALTFSDGDVFGVTGVDFGAPASTSVAFSIEAWVNGYTQTKDAAIVSKGFGGSEQFTLDVHGNVFRFFVRNAAGTAPNATSAISPTIGVWHHLVGVCDEANGVIKLYVDGVLSASSSIPAGSGILSTTNQMTIGSRPSGTTINDDQFVGFVNDVAVYGYALSTPAVLQHFYAAGIAPYFTQQPSASTNVDEHGSVSIPAVVAGTPSLAYQWIDLGTGLPVAGQTNATLVLSNVPASLNGDSFQLTVTNVFGTASSSSVSINVISGQPQIVRDLAPNVVLVAGQANTFSVGVIGTEPFGYQWYNGGSPIAGQTGSTYTFAASPGNYSVVITNIDGAATSTVSVVTVVAPRADLYASTIQSDGAVGYWPLNETNAPAMADIETNLGTFGPAGNAYYEASGAIQKGVSSALAGDSDPAITLNGTSGSWLGVPRLNPALTLSNAFTVEAWVNPADVNFAAIISQANPISVTTTGYRGDANVCGWALYQNGGSAGNFSFHLYNGVTGGGIEPKESAIYNVGAWQHVVATFDGAVVSLYVNGQFQTSQSISSVSPAVYAPNYWSPVQMGSSGLNRSVFNGSLDEVAMYNYALNLGQIQAHYAAGTNAGVGNYSLAITNDHPCLYYRMNSPAYTAPSSNSYPQAVNFGTLGSIANGYYLPGTLPGAVGPAILGASSAAAINGLNSAIHIPYNAALAPSGHSPFTLTAWFRGNPADGNGRWESIWGHSDRSVAFHLNNCLPYFNIGFTGGNTDIAVSTNLVNANDGKWHYFAGTYDGTTYTEYIDNLSTSAAGAAGGIPGTNSDIWIGGDAAFPIVDGSGSGYNQRYFPGSIAQVAFFTNALTSTQVLQLYSVGTNNIPAIRVGRSGGAAVITYTGTLLSATNVTGPYTPVSGAIPPTYTIPVTGPRMFYRTSN